METEKYKGKLSLVQPNKVTNARYQFSEREENILTLMISAIQDHMTDKKHIQTDLFNQPMITIDTNEFGEKTKAKYWEAALSMRSKTFDFEYTNQNGNIEEVAGVLITTARNEKQTSLIHLVINAWAVPYLVYVGKGVGFTSYNKAIAIALRGEYTKRLYKLCKRWENRGGFSMSLDEFREMLMLENKYSKLKDLKKWVLDKSKERLQENADIYFNYSLAKIGGSRSYNQINFTIHGNNKKLKQGQKTDMYTLVYNMLCISYPNHKSSLAMDITDRLTQVPSKFEEMYRRMKKLKNDIDVVDKTLEDANKLIKYIMKNDFNEFLITN
jgi:plasmid replication initiation protein